jgi:pyruvate formate lyase activating enzyme
MPYVDLWMISVKQMFDAIHKELIGVSNVNILSNIKRLDDLITEYNADSAHKEKKQIRIRFVIIPGITDTETHINALGEFVKSIKNLETMELLPYSTIGRGKWIELFGEYHLEGVPEATLDDVERVKSMLSNYINKFHYVVD